MNRGNLRGTSYVEFAFALLVLVPLLLGTAGVGINLLLVYQSSQLARDAGRMYARGIDFSSPSSKTILATLGSGIGLNSTTGVVGTAGAGSAVAVFTTVSYVDDAACAMGGYVDSGGVHTSACRNFGKWVFRQRIVVGNATIKETAYGSPLVTGPSPVIIDSGGNISLSAQLTNTGDVAIFASISPYNYTTGYGLPSGQRIFITEIAARGFTVPPYQTNPVQYVYNIF
jgi:hypothetical protein